MPIETKRKRKPKDYFIDWVFHDSSSQQLYRGDGIIISGAIGTGPWTGSGAGISRESDVLITGSANITGSMNITGSVDIQGTASADFFVGDGSGITNIPGATTFWTSSAPAISAESNVQITGSLLISGSTKFGNLLTELHELTGSVEISGSLNVNGTASVAEIVWDGAAENLSSYSASVATQLVDIETDSGSFDSRIDILELSASDSDIDSGSFDSRVDILELSASDSDIDSSSFDSRIDILEVTGAGGFWTGSGTNITRESDIQITGSAKITGNLTVEGIVIAEEFHAEFVSSSIIFSSGSTKFGDTLDDQHSFTGSVEISGSLNVNGTASVGELEWDGADQTLTLFSSSVSSELVDIETDSGSFFSRFALEEATSSFLVISASFNAQTASRNEASSSLNTATGSDHRARIILEEATSSFLITSASLNAATTSRNESTSSAQELRLNAIDLSGSQGLGFWSGSGTGISRESDVEISGSLNITGSGVTLGSSGVYDTTGSEFVWAEAERKLKNNQVEASLVFSGSSGQIATKSYNEVGGGGGTLYEVRHDYNNGDIFISSSAHNLSESIDEFFIHTNDGTFNIGTVRQ